MIDLTTVKELRALRLPGMARELESQLEDPQRYKTLSFEERLALLVDAESVSRRKTQSSAGSMKPNSVKAGLCGSDRVP